MRTREVKSFRLSELCTLDAALKLPTQRDETGGRGPTLTDLVGVEGLLLMPSRVRPASAQRLEIRAETMRRELAITERGGAARPLDCSNAYSRAKISLRFFYSQHRFPEIERHSSTSIEDKRKAVPRPDQLGAVESRIVSGVLSAIRRLIVRFHLDVLFEC